MTAAEMRAARLEDMEGFYQRSADTEARAVVRANMRGDQGAAAQFEEQRERYQLIADALAHYRKHLAEAQRLDPGAADGAGGELPTDHHCTKCGWQTTALYTPRQCRECGRDGMEPKS